MVLGVTGKSWSQEMSVFYVFEQFENHQKIVFGFGSGSHWEVWESGNVTRPPNLFLVGNIEDWVFEHLETFEGKQKTKKTDIS